MNKKSIFFIIAAFMISFSVFFMGYVKSIDPKEVYRVYLKGKEIGLIYSKDELYDYIDKEQELIKKKYGVEKVYAPNSLDVVKDITYNKNISGVSSIYEKIKDIEPFTIKGYIVTIKGVEEQTEDDEKVVTTEDKKVYVLDKKVFEKSVKSTAMAFVGEERYKGYENDTQKEIENTGTFTENIYIKNEIVIKEGNISVEEQIFLDTESLSKYLLFGTLDEQKKYNVKEGETIEDISFNNKLSVEEFLIANPQFTSADNLISKGQTVVLGVIQPSFKLIEEQHVVEIQDQKYSTKIEYDKNMYVGKEKVKQNGKNGKVKVTKKLQLENGAIISAVITNSDVLETPVDKIIVKGKKKYPTSEPITGSAPAPTGTWYWPTNVPYIITSPFGYRWGKLHEAVDISGTGYGSPIYAANDGTVVEAGYRYPNGNYVLINHHNGYYTIYAHMSHLSVSNGQTVKIGQKLGGMGKSGLATGTHLHFGVYKGRPFRGGVSINPMRLY